jgi:serine/threonine protein kinase
LLHEAGFVHRDLSPGNVIVVNGKAKISDLEFAKARKASDLQRLTKPPEESSSPAAVDTRTVSHFVSFWGSILTC